MKQNPLEDGLLRRYLLGELSQEERDELEGRLLGDDELFRLAEAVEADLLAAAARGELAPAERKQVLKRLASSPQGRERFALARTLNRAADEEHRDAEVVRFPGPSLARKPAFWTALAASVLAAVIGGYTLGGGGGSGGEQSPVEPTDSIGHQNPVQPTPTPQPDLPPAQQPVQESPDPIVQQPEEEQPAIEVVKPLGRAVLQLAFLAGDRGEGQAEALHEQLHMTPDIGTVELQLDVADYPGLKSFNVAVRNKEHDTIWQQSGLEPRHLDEEGESALVLEVPAAKLAAAGRYEVRIEGTKESGELEQLPAQEFEVVTSGNP